MEDLYYYLHISNEVRHHKEGSSGQKDSAKARIQSRQ